MTEAFVFDAIRTPRGKGKKDGSLHEVKPIDLLAGVLAELQRRNGSPSRPSARRPSRSRSPARRSARRRP